MVRRNVNPYSMIPTKLDRPLVVQAKLDPVLLVDLLCFSLNMLSRRELFTQYGSAYFPSIVCDIITSYIPFDNVVICKQSRIDKYLDSISLSGGKIVGRSGNEICIIDLTLAHDREPPRASISFFRAKMPYKSESIASVYASTQYIYVGDGLRNAIYVYPRSLLFSKEEMHKEITLPFLFCAMRISSPNDGKILCISDFRNSRILLYDTEKDVVTREVPLPKYCTEIKYDGKDRLYMLTMYDTPPMVLDLSEPDLRATYKEEYGRFRDSTDLLLVDNDFLVVADRCKKRLKVFRISTGECIYAYKLDFSPYEMAVEGDLLCVSDSSLKGRAKQAYAERRQITMFSIRCI